MGNPNEPAPPTLEDLKRELAAAREELQKLKDGGSSTAKELEAARLRIKELEAELAKAKQAPPAPPTPKERKSWAPWD